MNTSSRLGAKILKSNYTSAFYSFKNGIAESVIDLQKGQKGVIYGLKLRQIKFIECDQNPLIKLTAQCWFDLKMHKEAIRISTTAIG